MTILQIQSGKQFGHIYLKVPMHHPITNTNMTSTVPSEQHYRHMVHSDELAYVFWIHKPKDSKKVILKDVPSIATQDAYGLDILW